MQGKACEMMREESIDLSRFKVVHGEKVLNAVALLAFDFGDNEIKESDIYLKPKFLDIVAINEDGNILIIRDEAWTFQFIPVIRKD